MSIDYNFLVCTRCFTYNQSAYIEETLDGFAFQKTNFPFVCIIVDDCSTDGEQGVIQNYLNNHFDLSEKNVFFTKETEDYVYTFSQHLSNRNCYFAVYLLKYNHHSIGKSKFPYFMDYLQKAKYTALCEGDDYWIDSNKLQSQVEYLENNTDTVLCHTSFRYYYEDVNKFIGSKDVEINKRYNEVKPTDVFIGYRIQYCTVMHRNDVWLTIQKERDNSYSRFLDGELYYEMVRRGKVHFIPQVMVVYRIHSNSASHQSFKPKLRFRLLCAEMQLNLVQRDCHEESIIDYFKSKYDVALRNYLLWEPNYQITIPSAVPSQLEKLVGAKRFLMKWHLYYKDKLSLFVGRIRRLFINKL